MSEATGGKQTEREEPPPLLGRWPRLYLAVIGWLALLILLFYLFARSYTL
jgi:hypothetical protein